MPTRRRLYSCSGTVWLLTTHPDVPHIHCSTTILCTFLHLNALAGDDTPKGVPSHHTQHVWHTREQGFHQYICQPSQIDELHGSVRPFTPPSASPRSHATTALPSPMPSPRHTHDDHAQQAGLVASLPSFGHAGWEGASLPSFKDSMVTCMAYDDDVEEAGRSPGGSPGSATPFDGVQGAHGASPPSGALPPLGVGATPQLFHKAPRRQPSRVSSFSFAQPTATAMLGGYVQGRQFALVWCFLESACHCFA